MKLRSLSVILVAALGVTVVPGATIPAATATFSSSPGAATAGDAYSEDEAAHAHKTSPSRSTRISPVEENPAPKRVQNRDTDTVSLYEQAGLEVPPEVLLAGATGSGVPDGSLVPGLSRHVEPACVGTGTDGNRVQPMYVREADQADRYAQVLPVIENELRTIDDVFALSAMRTGGGRRVRWVTRSCTPTVLNVVVPDGALTGVFSKTGTALKNLGYTSPARKYLAFADVPMGGLGGGACGQAEFFQDPNATNNYNDGRQAQTARIDTNCWARSPGNGSMVAHELLHMLGATVAGSPHSGTAGHCNDAADLMCYPDGTNGQMQEICPADQKDFLDCNGDDYFNTDPQAGNWLATRWNTANSAFLTTVPMLSFAREVTISSSISTVVTTKRPIKVAFTASTGRPTVFKGQVTDGRSGATLSGRPVVLQVKWAGTTRWVKVVALTTNRLGNVAHTRPRGPRAGTFRIRFAGSYKYSAVNSVTRFVGK